MKKVITIGGATSDIFLQYEGADIMTITQKSCQTNYMLFKSGEKIEAENILFFTGGGATNSAVSFKRLGFNVSCFCKIGYDQAAEDILKDLKKEKIEIKDLIRTKKYKTAISFVINSLNKERTIFAFRGANGYLEEKEIPLDSIKKSDLIYITSLSNKSAELLPKIVSFAHKNKKQVAINPGISQLSSGAITLKNSLKYIDILILNCAEAKTFMIALVKSDSEYKKIFQKIPKYSCPTNLRDTEPYLIDTPLPYEDFYFNIKSFFKEVLKLGPKIVVITNGSNGVYVSTKNQILFHPSIKIPVENTLGAGDAFGSCFVASLMHGTTIKDALKNGILNSASVISKIGAKPGLLTNKQLQEKAKKYKQDLIKVYNF